MVWMDKAKLEEKPLIVLKLSIVSLLLNLNLPFFRGIAKR
jgi:hypothetical protein